MKTVESVVCKILEKNRERKSKRLLSEILGRTPTVIYPSFLIKGMNHVKSLKQINDFSLNYLNGKWICYIENLAFVLNSSEELFILEEVFIDGIYNVELNQPFVFIDIGMNVGITSLFFAKKAMCKKVIAFEPFQPTLLLAKKNFEKNEISKKIQVNEIGLGYPTRTVVVSYSDENKGCVGIGGAVSSIARKKDVREEQLRIMDVFEALNDIADERIILKIDCEGSEYEIMERLNDTRLLSRFDAIMIEWHFKGAASLQKMLLDNNFKILSTGEHNLNAGMLYAFKK